GRDALVLARPDAGGGGAEGAGAGAADAGPDAAPSAEPAKARYRGETAIGETPISTLSRAVDSVLGRTVIIERFRERDERPEKRLLALAAGTSPFLQRVLGFDRRDRVAIYEAPVGVPLAGRLPAAPRRLAAELTRALLAVHAAGGSHGAVAAERVLIDDEF